jgi:hypothetical protein
MPDALALKLVANAHTAIAINAAVHVGRDVRVRSVLETRISRAAQLSLEPVFANPSIEFFFGEATEGLSRMAPRQQFQERPAALFERWRVSVDRHAGREWCRTGRHGSWPVLDADQAQPTGTRRGQTVVVTERGETKAELLDGSQDGQAFLTLMGVAVDHDVKHVVLCSNRNSTLKPKE